MIYRTEELIKELKAHPDTEIEAVIRNGILRTTHYLIPVNDDELEFEGIDGERTIITFEQFAKDYPNANWEIIND